MKGYCTCEKKIFTYRPLPHIPGPIFVHAACGFPSHGVWENFIKRCPNCLGLFSSPWEQVCRPCFKELDGSRIYNSWSWAAKLVYEFTLDESLKTPSLCASLSLASHLPASKDLEAAIRPTVRSGANLGPDDLADLVFEVSEPKLGSVVPSLLARSI